MADIEFECPECHKSIVADERIVGMAATCPHCNAPLAFQADATEERANSADAQSFHSASASTSKEGNSDATTAGEEMATSSAPKPDRHGQRDVYASCPKCGEAQLAVKCPNCDKGDALTLGRDGFECYCGIRTNQIVCPKCHAIITAKFFQQEPMPPQDARPSNAPSISKPAGHRTLVSSRRVRERQSTRSTVIGVILISAIYIGFKGGCSSISTGDIHLKCPACAHTASLTTCGNCGTEHRFVRETKRSYVKCGNCKEFYTGFECHDCGVSISTDDADHVWLK